MSNAPDSLLHPGGGRRRRRRPRKAPWLNKRHQPTDLLVHTQSSCPHFAFIAKVKATLKDAFDCSDFTSGAL